jgi:hypothetical protein
VRGSEERKNDQSCAEPCREKKEVIQKYSVRTLRESRETQRPLAIRAACLH